MKLGFVIFVLFCFVLFCFSIVTKAHAVLFMVKHLCLNTSLRNSDGEMSYPLCSAWRSLGSIFRTAHSRHRSRTPFPSRRLRSSVPRRRRLWRQSSTVRLWASSCATLGPLYSEVVGSSWCQEQLHKIRCLSWSDPGFVCNVGFGSGSATRRALCHGSDHWIDSAIKRDCRVHFSQVPP